MTTPKTVRLPKDLRDQGYTLVLHDQVECPHSGVQVRDYRLFKDGTRCKPNHSLLRSPDGWFHPKSVQNAVDSVRANLVTT